MRKRLILVCVTLAALCFPEQALGQFTDPRTYENTPIGVNQLEIGYAYVRSNASIDTSLVVADAKFNLNQGLIDYTYYFGLFHRLAWVQPSVPIASLDGSISGTRVRGAATGFGDSSYQAGMLLKGGPALNTSEFANYKPTTTIGVSITVTAPTGLYNPDKLLNLGSDRWSFTPEIAMSHPFGRDQAWKMDLYANADFYTDNTSYHGVEILTQRPLPGVEAHLSYAFTDKVWASIDTRYSFWGVTLLNGVNQQNPQQNVTLGGEVNVALNSQNLLIFEVARAMVHKNGPVYTGFSVRYDYSWGKGLK